MKAFVCATVLTIATPCWAQSTPAVPEANPGRPTVSAPATLTPLGSLQLETGVLVARTSPGFSSRTAVNEVLKFAPHRRMQFIAQFEPFVSSHSSDTMVRDLGGIALGAQVLLSPPSGARPAVAVSYLRSLPVGSAPDLDIGSARQSVVVLIGTDIGGFHLDVNGILNEQIDGDRSRLQVGQVLAVSHPVGVVTMAGEVWRFTQPATGTAAAGALWAIAYPVRPNLVIDAAIARGLTNTSTRWQFAVGFTYATRSLLGTR